MLHLAIAIPATVVAFLLTNVPNFIYGRLCYRLAPGPLPLPFIGLFCFDSFQVQIFVNFNHGKDLYGHFSQLRLQVIICQKYFKPWQRNMGV